MLRSLVSRMGAVSGFQRWIERLHARTLTCSSQPKPGVSSLPSPNRHTGAVRLGRETHEEAGVVGGRSEPVVRQVGLAVADCNDREVGAR